MSEEMQIPEGARVVIHVPPMPESELVKHLQDMYVQVQRDLSRYRVDAINEAQRRRAAEDERDDLERELAASQAETLELRQRVLDSANGMDRLNARIAELEQEREDVRRVAHKSLCDISAMAAGADEFLGWKLDDEAEERQRVQKIGAAADAALGRMLKERENGRD